MVNASKPVLLDCFYLPPIHYFAYIAKHDAVFLDCDSVYAKGTYRNRCRIATSNGPLTLSVPLRAGKYLQPLNQIRIAYDESWQRQHWRSIRDAYRNAPFFQHYEGFFESELFKKHDTLLELNLSLLELTTKLLKLPMPIPLKETLVSEELEKTNFYRPSLPAFKAWKEEAYQTGFPKYVQVFEDRIGFLPNLCILDLIFCCGTESVSLIKKIKTGG